MRGTSFFAPYICCITRLPSMKSTTIQLLAAAMLIVSTGMTIAPRADEVELVCVKKHSASNMCHYNFRIAGANYRYQDIGCKGKKEDILQRAKDGKLGLAKEWKLECPAPKEDKSGGL